MARKFWIAWGSQNSLGCKPLHPTFSHKLQPFIVDQTPNHQLFRGRQTWSDIKAFASSTASSLASKTMTSLWSTKRRTHLIRGPCQYPIGRSTCLVQIPFRTLFDSPDIHDGYHECISDLHQVTDKSPQGAEIHHQSLRVEPYGKSTDPENIFIPLTVHRNPSETAYHQSFVNGLMDLAHQHSLIGIRPASSKTTIRKLMANALLDKSPHIPVHVIIGWDKEEVTANKGWDVHLKLITGTQGSDWSTKPGFILLYEAQQSYWDKSLWSSVFKDTSPHSEFTQRPSVIFFSSYGSPGRGNHGFGEHKYFQTPPYFADKQMIGMHPEESNLHILLDHMEVTDIMNTKVRTVD